MNSRPRPRRAACRLKRSFKRFWRNSLRRIALLDENLLAELRVDIEVTWAAENAQPGDPEIGLDWRGNARGRIVGLELVRGVARRIAGAVNRGADPLDVGVDDGCQEGSAESAAGVDLRADLAVRRREGCFREGIDLQIGRTWC